MPDPAKRHPPIPIRDSGGRFTINNPKDGTKIEEQFPFNNGLLFITEKCTYRVQLADQIDPERKHPNLSPIFQQKIFDHGVSSEILCKTLLQAKVLFRKEFQIIDIETAMQFAFNAAESIIAMHDVKSDFCLAEQKAITDVELLSRIDASFTVLLT